MKASTKKTNKCKAAKNQPLTLSPPWDTYYSMTEAFFRGDPEIELGDIKKVEEGVYKFTIKSDNKDKIAALNKILRKDIKIGNVTLQVRPQSKRKVTDLIIPADYRTAFDGNEYFVDIVNTDKGLFTDMTYIIMAKEVVLFYNDQLDDLNGNKAMVVKDIMDAICEPRMNVYFSTQE